MIIKITYWGCFVVGLIVIFVTPVILDFNPNEPITGVPEIMIKGGIIMTVVGLIAYTIDCMTNFSRKICRK